jgi:heme exporter protein A
MAFERVTARGLTKLYGRHRALSSVSVSFEPGKLCALLGPNGAGKSTLLGILSTLVRPTSGEVVFERPGDVEPLGHKEIRRGIGVLAHEAMVYGELSAQENLKFFADLYDLPRGAERARALLGEVGLDDEAQKRPARTYSRGMLQRLALARALLHEPRLLLLDEPFTGLDRSGTLALGRTLAAARRDGRIVVVVTHDLDALDNLVDHVVVIKRGKLVHEERFDGPIASSRLRETYFRFTD